MDLLPKVTRWVNTTSQDMGNWGQKDQILQQELADAKKMQPVPVSKGGIPLNLVSDGLKTERELVVIGFDVLQIPKYKITFRIK